MTTKTLNLDSKETLPWVEKYRPVVLDDVVSHNLIVDTLKTFIAKDKLPHLLFHGPPGSGKTSIIMACARELYKENFGTMVLIINASEERGIEIVRNNITQFSYSKGLVFDDISKKNSYKLVILDEADAMTVDAQASLRRVIEKYTHCVRFCLICNYIKKIDIAIQSRCTCFRFAPLKNNYIKQKLKYIIEKEKISYDDAGIINIIKKSDGDMRRVLNSLQTTFMAYGSITEDNVNKCLGYPDKSVVDSIIYSLVHDTFINSHNLLKKFKDDGYSINYIISEINDEMVEYLLGKNTKYSKISEQNIMNILKVLGSIEYNICNLNTDSNQLSALVGSFKLYKN